MRWIVLMTLGLLIAGCQQHISADTRETEPECRGYSDGYTVRC